jgi:ABC-type antimicrobial peptide transport system permease subunit
MHARTLALAVAAGLAAFLAVGAAVTEVALRWIEFSLFVGLPVGGVAGVTAAALVALGSGDEASDRQRAVGAAVGAFGVAFLLAFTVAVGVFSVPNSRALTLSTLVALGAAAGANALDLAGTASSTD